MPLISRFARSFIMRGKSDRRIFRVIPTYFHGVWKKCNLPVIHLQEKASGPCTKLLYFCALMGSSYLLVISTKNILCEDKIRNSDHQVAIRKSRDLVQKIKDEVGAPGIVVGVSIDGKVVWEEGIGYADVENRVRCTRDTVMRIASISKSFTMAAVAKLWEDGKLDLDKPVQDYVPHFPAKTFEGQPVTLTCRHLVSHLGGIRHYTKNVLKSNAEKEKEKEKEKTSKDAKDIKNMELKQAGNAEGSENKSKANEFEEKEYFIKERFEDIKSSLDLFKDDPLLSKPGTKYLYSTHGWTLVSAIVESAAKEQFPLHMKKLLKQLGMYHTYFDVNEALIYNRSRNYIKDKRGHIINAPYVDNSYKWAGGGFLSTVGDLLRFGNSMLYSLQYRPNSSQASISTTNGVTDQKSSEDSSTLAEAAEKGQKSPESSQDATGVEDNVPHMKMLPGYLNHKTVEMMWSPIVNVKTEDWYGMGWGVAVDKQNCQFCESLRFLACHSGGAIGASSILLVLPERCDSTKTVECKWPDPPRGVVVSIFTNLQDVNLGSTALWIALIFETYSKYL